MTIPEDNTYLANPKITLYIDIDILHQKPKLNGLLYGSHQWACVKMDLGRAHIILLIIDVASSMIGPIA